MMYMHKNTVDIPGLISFEELASGGIVLMTIGIPGSGKTTFAKKLCEEYGFIRICPDDIREELYGDKYDQQHNKDVFSKVYKDLSVHLDRQDNIIYDATNCRSIYRRKIINQVKSQAKKIIGVVFTTNILECMRRVESRDDYDFPEKVIERMHTSLNKQLPTLSEGFDILVKQ